MLNQNFAFAEDFVTLTDEELSLVQGGKSLWYNIGYVAGVVVGGILVLRKL